MSTNEKIDRELRIKTELYKAYFDCRRNKRNTHNALAFEIQMEQNLDLLYRQIMDGSYVPGKSVVFIVTKPVVREIFAADFRDRVIHHFIINRVVAYLERMFIYDSYSCRKDKGTLFGIKRVEHFMRACSQNYRKDCFILKLDIQGFFMHIDRKRLLQKINAVIEKYCCNEDKKLMYDLCEKVILQNPIDNCITKGSFDEWEKLPKNKSLFHVPKGCGLPIGNLTSQLFANLYLNDFDHFVKRKLKAKYYGRYVDDMVLFDHSKKKLLEWRDSIKEYLENSLELSTHPSKEYLQHFSKGVTFLGAHIMPYRTYIGRRTLNNFNRLVVGREWTGEIDLITGQGLEPRTKRVKSYLGLMKHFKTHNIITKFEANSRTDRNIHFLYDY